MGFEKYTIDNNTKKLSKYFKETLILYICVSVKSLVQSSLHEVYITKCECCLFMNYMLRTFSKVPYALCEKFGITDVSLTPSK